MICPICNTYDLVIDLQALSGFRCEGLDMTDCNRIIGASLDIQQLLSNLAEDTREYNKAVQLAQRDQCRSLAGYCRVPWSGDGEDQSGDQAAGGEGGKG
jgi:hypothetical protein